MDIPLQPLRIPSGWLVAHNDGLYEIDPSGKTIPKDIHDSYFREDMLQLWHDTRNRLIDVGWYPEGDLQHGQYGLVLYEGDATGRQLYEFRTRDRLKLVAEIERLLVGVIDETL